MQCPKTEIALVRVCLEDTTTNSRTNLESDESSICAHDHDGKTKRIWCGFSLKNLILESAYSIQYIGNFPNVVTLQKGTTFNDLINYKN